jgi:hypothetical protein
MNLLNALSGRAMAQAVSRHFHRRGSGRFVVDEVELVYVILRVFLFSLSI